PVKVFADTLVKNWDRVLHWFESRIGNGILEAINSLVQAAKRRARGYRSKRNYIAMIYMTAGKLNFTLPT
ncbi:MAG: transposase, partial [Chloroflexi bacterium]